MEFYKQVEIETNETQIQSQLKGSTIEQVNPEIIFIEGNDDSFKIGCIWGEFNIKRDNIKGGVRFSMIDCPNALAWTITTGYPPDRNKVFIHLTINRLQKPNEFIAEVQDFLDSWENSVMSLK